MMTQITWVTAIHLGDSDGVPCSQFWSSQDLAFIKHLESKQSQKYNLKMGKKESEQKMCVCVFSSLCTLPSNKYTDFLVFLF